MGSGFPLFSRFIKLNPYSAIHRGLTKALVTDAAYVLPCLVNLRDHQAIEANSRAMSRDAKTVASWDFHRIIPCHGVICLDYAMYSVSDPHPE
jgi:hypothetical protein